MKGRYLVFIFWLCFLKPKDPPRFSSPASLRRTLRYVWRGLKWLYIQTWRCERWYSHWPWRLSTKYTHDFRWTDWYSALHLGICLLLSFWGQIIYVNFFSTALSRWYSFNFMLRLIDFAIILFLNLSLLDDFATSVAELPLNIAVCSLVVVKQSNIASIDVANG